MLYQTAFSRRWWWTPTNVPDDPDLNYKLTQSVKGTFVRTQEQSRKKLPTIEISEIGQSPQQKYSKQDCLFEFLHSRFLVDKDISRLKNHQIVNLQPTYEVTGFAYSRYQPSLRRKLNVVSHPQAQRMSTKLVGGFQIGFKKFLHKNLKAYYKHIGVSFGIWWFRKMSLACQCPSMWRK